MGRTVHSRNGNWLVSDRIVVTPQPRRDSRMLVGAGIPDKCVRHGRMAPARRRTSRDARPTGEERCGRSRWGLQQACCVWGRRSEMAHTRPVVDGLFDLEVDGGRASRPRLECSRRRIRTVPRRPFDRRCEGRREPSTRRPYAPLNHAGPSPIQLISSEFYQARTAWRPARGPDFLTYLTHRRSSGWAVESTRSGTATNCHDRGPRARAGGRFRGSRTSGGTVGPPAGVNQRPERTGLEAGFADERESRHDSGGSPLPRTAS